MPRFEVVARRRPVDLVCPGSVVLDQPLTAGGRTPTPHPAPYAAVVADLDPGPFDGRLELELVSGDVRLAGWYDGSGALGLTVTAGGRTSIHRSRRHGRVPHPAAGVGLTLTGTHLTVLSRDESPDRSPGRDPDPDRGPVGWTVRGRVDLRDRVDTRDEAWLAALTTGHRWVGSGAPPGGRLRAGGFGQLGLRDVRVVTAADGSPYRDDGRLLLTATSAGPGFFDTAHTSVWALDTDSLDVEHRADLFFRRPGRPGVFGDHATHLVRDGDRWLVATSTWGDFDPGRPDATVAVTLAVTDADLLTGRHVLDTRPLALPTGDLRSVGVWDPHLVRERDRWLVGFVSARRFFRFHPALAEGPSLDALALRAADPGRIATEGTTLLRLDGDWRVLASDGRDGRRGQRRGYPVLDLDLTPVGALDAPYLTNIPWPTLVPADDGGWLMVTFDGTPYGGPLPGYGTHGDLVLLRT
nr:hypothetical protein [Nocardioides panaciterrulae]